MSALPPLIDIGINLTDRAFSEDLGDVLERAAAAGVDAMIITGTGEAASGQALELAQRHPGRLFSTAGIHPHHAKDLHAGTLETLRALAHDPAVRAIGETGLDFNRDFSPRPLQERAFESQLQLACELGLPVFLHQRDAHERFVAILRDYRDRLVDGVAHCFTGDRSQLWDYLDLDLHVGITGWVCDERRGQALQACVADIPLDRLMVETDGPYLLPRDLKPRPRSGRNEPAFLPHVLRALARHAGHEATALAAATTANAQRFFRLPEGGLVQLARDPS